MTKQQVKPYHNKEFQKLTEKQELFCQTVVIDCCTAVEAYKKNYACHKMKDWNIFKEASKLVNRPHIARRIDELRNDKAFERVYSRDKATEEFEEVRQLAMQNNELSAANTAINGKAKVNGLFNFAQEHKHTHSIEFVQLLRQEMGTISDDNEDTLTIDNEE